MVLFKLMVLFTAGATDQMARDKDAVYYEDPISLNHNTMGVSRRSIDDIQPAAVEYKSFI